MFLNVRSQFSAACVASSSIPVFFNVASASASTCFVVTFARMPVNLMTAFVCAITFWPCENWSKTVLTATASPTGPTKAPTSPKVLRLMPPKARLLFVCVFSTERPKVLADFADFFIARSSEEASPTILTTSSRAI